jgi:hypothetical protein
VAYYLAAVFAVFGVGCVLDGFARLLGAGLADATTVTGDPRRTAIVLLCVGAGLLIGAVVTLIVGTVSRFDSGSAE